MKKRRFMPRTSWHWLVIGIVFSFIPPAVMRADEAAPDPDAILQSMSSYLAETKALSVNADSAALQPRSCNAPINFISSGKG
jgi:hypothetical protein